MIINAEGLILGKFANLAAKKALMGEEVIIINCDMAVVSGSYEWVNRHYKRRRDMGTYKGPIISRLSERMVKRAIRGMLPYKQERGREALGRIRCFRRVPPEFEGKEYIKIEKADSARLMKSGYVSLNDICRNLGGKA